MALGWFPNLGVGPGKLASPGQSNFSWHNEKYRAGRAIACDGDLWNSLRNLSVMMSACIG